MEYGYHVSIIGPRSMLRDVCDVAVDLCVSIETSWSEAHGGPVFRRSVGFFETRGEAIKFARSVFGSMGYRVRY